MEAFIRYYKDIILSGNWHALFTQTVSRDGRRHNYSRSNQFTLVGVHAF